MITDVLREADSTFRAFSGQPSPTELADILAKDDLTRLDYLKLLASDDLGILEMMARRARSLTERYFGKMMLLFAPLYLSDYCSNGCTYCGYST
ncbi:MAG: 2-iminoacetate synthase ThiH, partial [Patescibacteria group bacterium]|nr:2-iminoacetate synthase ThiH [Patescibacteria group bacterium]